MHAHIYQSIFSKYSCFLLPFRLLVFSILFAVSIPFNLYCKSYVTQPGAVVPNHCSAEHQCSASWSQVFRKNLINLCFSFYYPALPRMMRQVITNYQFKLVQFQICQDRKHRIGQNILGQHRLGQNRNILVFPNCFFYLKCSATQKRLGTTDLGDASPLGDNRWMYSGCRSINRLMGSNLSRLKRPKLFFNT